MSMPLGYRQVPYLPDIHTILNVELEEGLLERVQEINSLDMELYRFAVALLHQRVDQWRIRDPHFQVYYKYPM